MANKLKFLIKLCLIWGGFLAVYLLFSMYQNIKEYKLLNYNETYSSSEIKAKSEYKSNTSLSYVFEIVSHDNYLGSITFKYFRLKGIPGQVIFRLRKVNQLEWYAQNRYDFSYFNNDDNYSFGFPVIPDSKNKEFTVEFEIVTPNLSQQLNFLDLNAAPILTAKYVFPRDSFYKSPKLMATILLNRSLSIIDSLDLIKVAFITLTFATMSAMILNRQQTNGRHNIFIRPKDIHKNVQKLSHWTSRINPFFVPALVLVVLATAFISGNFPLAERFSVYLWVTLLASAVFYILQVTVINRLSRLREFVNLISVNTISTLDDLIIKKTLVLLGILFIFISGLSSTYYLGGDDSRLFYLYPQEFLNNYTSKIGSDTGFSQLTNLFPPSSLSALMLTLIVLKKILPFFNLQAMLNSANLVGGFFAFYYLVSNLLRSKGKYQRVICILTSFMYVFSIFNFYTLLNSRLITQYLISLFPLSLLLGLKSVREGKFYLMVLVAMIWSVLSLAIPLSGAALLTTTPLLILFCWRHKKRSLIYLASLVVILVALNIHWLTFIPYTNFSRSLPGSSAPSLTSAEFRKQNENGIRTVTEINNSFFPLLNSYHQKIQLDFHWPQLPIYRSWYLKFLPLGYVFILIVIWSGISIDKDKGKTSLYVASIASFALAIYFFTVNIGPWGTSVYLWLSNHIPGFVIFRNPYDKFAFAVAFQWAFILAVSLIILIKSFKVDRHKNYLLFLIFLIIIINAKPFIFGEFKNLPYWTTKFSHDGIRAFNNDYVQLLDFVKNQNTPGRYLSLPLLTGNSVIVEDKYQKNHYYAGISPLLIFTGKNDLSGLISFSDKANDVYQWIRDKEYEKFAQLLQQFNVKYVIVNNSISTDLQNSFMFSDGLYYLQTSEFINSLVGEKIKDFGARYSLYEINPKYHSDKIFITVSPNTFANQGAKLSYVKKSSHSYEIEISDLKSQMSLVFLDPYLKQWQLLTRSGQQLSAENQHVVFDYANMWELDPSVIKSELMPTDYQLLSNGTMSLKLNLYFQPYNYFYVFNSISVGAYLLGLAYVIKSVHSSKHL